MKNAQYVKDSQRYESVKFQAKMELSLIESCMGKCAVNFNDSASKLDGSEEPCMKKCFNKFFDSNLVIDKELTLYTHGNPYV